MHTKYTSASLACHEQEEIFRRPSGRRLHILAAETQGAAISAMEESGLSQHPVDRLIRELIRTCREATTEEVERIIRRMATAPFDRRVLPVPPPLRGLTYQGITLGERADALFRHTVQRVVDEKQWADGTTQNEYLDDVRRAVADSSARLAVYERRGGSLSVVFAPNVVPEDRKGAGRLDYIFVVHSSDRGTIISGYQVSGLSEVSIPRGTKWLR